MKIKRFIIAVLATVMLLAMLPLNVTAYGETWQYPTVSLAFTRDASDPTRGTLAVTSVTLVSGYFTYTASLTAPVTPLTPVQIEPFKTKYITLTNVPLATDYYITYCTSYLTQSPIATYTIPPYSGSGAAVSILSSSRSGSDVTVSLSVNQPCTFYYGTTSNLQDEKLCEFISTGYIPNVTLTDISTNIVYYKTVTSNGTESEVKWFTVGGSGSGSVANYPNLSSYYLYTATGEYATFSYTSDKSGFIYYIISPSPVTTISPSFSTAQTITSGSGSFNIPLASFSNTNAKMYFVTVDGSTGYQSPVMSVALNSGSSSAGYPNLTNCSFVLTSATSGTFSYTSDKPGSIYYIVSATPVTNFSPSGSSQLSSGNGSFTITDNNLLASGAKIYYFTVDSTGQHISPVQSVTIGSGSVAAYPNLSNVYFAVPSQNPYTGTLTFTSDSAGFLFYVTSTSTNVTKTSTTFGYRPITDGQNLITIDPGSYTQSLLGVRLYYYTVNATTGASSPLAYVMPNTSSSVGDAVISSVGIKNITAPVTGAYPSYNYNVTNNDTRFTVAYVDWYNAQNVKLSPSDKFQPGNQYSVVITLNAKTGYSFPANSSQFSAKINDKSASLVNYTTASVTFKYTFSIAAAVDIKNVVANGITEPVAGDRPDTTGIPGDNTYYVSSVEWLNIDSQPVTKFVLGEFYTLNVTLTPAAGYKFNVESAKIGTRNATIVSKPADGSKVVISYKYWVNPFKDIKEYDVEPSTNYPDGIANRYYVYIKYCYLNELFFGTSATTFAPQSTMTRAMFVTVLGRLAGVDVNSYKSDKFKDVSANSWYAPYVAWAVQNGIAVGKSETTFAPDDPVTREQMCVFMYRYAKYADIPLGYIKRAIGFTDAEKISSWAEEAVSIFEQAGVALSRPNTTGFDPKEYAQRQEIAEILILFMLKYMND